jgi:hypothetical protein
MPFISSFWRQEFPKTHIDIFIDMTGNVTQINYLMKTKNDKLKLIEGDSETFANVLSMIDEYEGRRRVYDGRVFHSS